MDGLKVSKLQGAQLDYWVARAGEVWAWAHELFPTMTLDPTFKGVELFTFEGGRTVCRLVPRNPFRQDYRIFTPSTSWEHGGPIIERERILLWPCTQANYGNPIRNWTARVERTPDVQYFSDTPLVAAMRADVASKFGDEVAA
ncbi:hypothetical protein AYJ54_07670 [Bradyrhizobium centrolobii]|uniref:Uncharacterized protein n=1 Tax=Bradyrhizobium centrolobii TaxID=1505087 RepID=A0A176YXY0_9BRAD|nr:phage protein NinX family protein [Bradyrhizobium centrolobii]OAF11735.1 hypothetical protein AYJ54_07670 [Bradyrhizobium centrolobii]